MSNQEAISGLVIFQVEQNKNRQILIGDYHHMLRRFGQLELLNINQEQENDFRQRLVADEIIFIDQGLLSIQFVDFRSNSPSFGLEKTLKLIENSMEAILVPFGLAYSLSSKDGAKIIRLATHNDEDDEPQILTESHVSNILKSK